MKGELDKIIELLVKQNEHLRRIDYDIGIIKKSIVGRKRNEKGYKFKHNNSNNFYNYTS